MLLNSILVRHIMTTSVVALREHQSLRLASARGFTRGEDHVPVVDEHGRFLGLLNHRDLVAAERSRTLARGESQRHKQVPLSAIITRGVETVSLDASVQAALEQMLAGKLDLLPVIDEEGAFSGLVTMDSMLGLCAEWADSMPRNVAAIMTRGLVTAKGETRVSQAIDLMETAKVRHLPIVDSSGRLLAIVSLRDLHAYQRALYGDERDEGADICMSDFMGAELWTVTGKTSIFDAVQTLRDNRFGCLPVVEDAHLLGILTETDVLSAFLRENRKQESERTTRIPVRHYMSKASLRVSPEDRVERALALFVQSGASTLLVTDGGEALGILSQSDLLQALHIPRFGGGDGERARLLARPVSELMSRGIITIEAYQDVREAAEVLARANIHSLVVVDGGELVGSFGAREIYRAVGDSRPAGRLRDVMTNVIFEIDCNEPLRSGLRFLESAGVGGLVVRDGGQPVGIFGQREALAAANQPLETPVDHLMSSRIVCLPADMLCFRAAQQVGALGVDQIVVIAEGDTCGLISAADVVPLLVTRTLDQTTQDTVDQTHGR